MADCTKNGPLLEAGGNAFGVPCEFGAAELGVVSRGGLALLSALLLEWDGPIPAVVGLVGVLKLGPILPIFDIDRDPMDSGGTIVYVKTSGSTQGGGAGVVDSPMLSQVLLPRDRKEQLGKPMRVGSISIETPPVSTGSEAYQSDLLHYLEELV